MLNAAESGPYECVYGQPITTYPDTRPEPPGIAGGLCKHLTFL